MKLPILTGGRRVHKDNRSEAAFAGIEAIVPSQGPLDPRRMGCGPESCFNGICSRNCSGQIVTYPCSKCPTVQ